MPKVTKQPRGKAPAKAPARGRRRAAPVYDEPEEVNASSVLFGLAMLVSIIVAAAAWMGGSLSQVESRMANATDGAARTVGLSVEDVLVYGLESDPDLEQMIRGAAMIEPGENMFRADPYVIRNRIESTRRVLNVRVHRLWPGQVVILAEKAQPAALWNDGEEWAVLDQLGRKLPDTDPERYSHLLKVSGPGGADAAPALIEAMQDAPDIFASVSYAARVGDRRWDLHLTTGAKARLPGDDALADAVTRLEGIEQRTALSTRNVATIDLRAEGQVVLTPARTTTSIKGGAA